MKLRKQAGSLNLGRSRNAYRRAGTAPAQTNCLSGELCAWQFGRRGGPPRGARTGSPGRGSARCFQPGTHRGERGIAAAPRARARACDPPSRCFDQGGAGAGRDGNCQECRLSAARRYPHWRCSALLRTDQTCIAGMSKSNKPVK